MNKGYAMFFRGVGGREGRYASGEWEISSCGPSSRAPSWRRLCDEPIERLRGKLKTLEIYWDLEIIILGLFCLKARLAPL